MPTYDAAAAALEILGAYAEHRNPSASSGAKQAAAKDLLAQVAALNDGAIDLIAAGDPGYRHSTVSVSFSFAHVRVTYATNSDKFIVFDQDRDIKIPVPLRFNRVRGIFEGEEIDTSRVPVPGEMKEKRRDALVVIADAIVNAMKKSE